MQHCYLLRIGLFGVGGGNGDENGGLGGEGEQGYNSYILKD